MEALGPFLAAALTLLVLSRVLGDSPVFRATQYFFVGISLGFSLVVIGAQLLTYATPVLRTDATTELLLSLLPLLLGVLLLSRLASQRVSWMANIPLGVLFGAAAALAIGGALLGTLGPQLRATIAPANTPGDMASQIGRWIVLPLGITLVLISFTYNVRTGRSRLIWGAASSTGRWLLIASLGTVFAGSMLSYLTALIEQVNGLIGLAR